MATPTLETLRGYLSDTSLKYCGHATIGILAVGQPPYTSHKECFGTLAELLAWFIQINFTSGALSGAGLTWLTERVTNIALLVPPV